jgi:hypothetical protein
MQQQRTALFSERLKGVRETCCPAPGVVEIIGRICLLSGRRASVAAFGFDQVTPA